LSTAIICSVCGEGGIFQAVSGVERSKTRGFAVPCVMVPVMVLPSAARWVWLATAVALAAGLPPVPVVRSNACVQPGFALVLFQVEVFSHTYLPPATDLLQDDLYDVLGKKPVVLVFATPQLCQSRVCGPVEDVVEQVKSETKGDMAFIHNEVYVDNNPNKGIRPQLTAYGLQTEPWTFVIDKTGKVVERFEGALSVDELKQAVAKVS